MKIMKFFALIKNKLNKTSGETITEVLVASLVIAFGSIILATMVIASTRIIEKSIKAYNRYTNIHNAAEMLFKNVDVNDIYTKTNETVDIDINKSITISGGKSYAFINGHEDNTVDPIYLVDASVPVKLYTVPKLSDLGEGETKKDVLGMKSFSKYFY